MSHLWQRFLLASALLFGLVLGVAATVFGYSNTSHVAVASKGGAPTNPAWYHNLVANPVVTVEALGETFKARARVIDGKQDYERLYREHARKMPGFNEYRKRTSRRIPVIVLERVDSEHPA